MILVLWIAAAVLVAAILMLAVLGVYAAFQNPPDPEIPDLSITAIVPAHNEEEGIADTLESLVGQFDYIVVVADNCTDRTAEIAARYDTVRVVVTPEGVGGSKAKAQNYGLQFCDTDLVLPVDADTLLAPDYVKLIKQPFTDPNVVIAAGAVMTRFRKRLTERGRTLEYNFGFHFHRPIQNVMRAPMVCSGCCSAFLTSELKAFGGFPERTIVEDMDYTWTKQIEGKKAVYVGRAVAYAADPTNLKYLSVQMKRWMNGFFQNVRIHAVDLVKHKRMLAIWVGLACWEIITVPIWYAMPFIWIFFLHFTVLKAGAWFFGAEMALLLPPMIYGSLRRKMSVLHMFSCIPALYVVKMINFTFAWRGLIDELILVPLGWSKGLHDYEKGRADTPAEIPAAVPTTM